MKGLDPVQIIATFASFMPWVMTLMATVFGVVGLVTIGMGLAGIRNINDGQGSRTLMSCVLQILFGAGFIVMTSIVAVVGVSATHMEPANTGALLYDAQASGTIDKVSLAAFLALIQAAGLFAVFSGWGEATRISTGQLRPGESASWPSALIKFFGGIACIFVQWSIGFAGALLGIPVAQWMNSL